MKKPRETPTRKFKQKQMQPQPQLQPPPPSHHEMDPTDTLLNPNVDLCQQLLDRYSSSAAAHHRNLCATAGAMRSILLDDSLPLTPLSYFAATITATSESLDDAASLASLTTFLSILLPVVPEGSIGQKKAVEAAEILIKGLEEPSAIVSTSAVKCVVKCLGVLVGFCDRADWSSVKMLVEKLLEFSVDKRPKVRKCAQVCLENVYQLFESPAVVIEASKMIKALLKNCLSLVAKSGKSEVVSRSKGEAQAQPDHSEAAHVLSVIKITVPYLSSKVRIKVVSELLTLMNSQLCMLPRLVINIIEAFFRSSMVDDVTPVAEDVVVALSTYISVKENAIDTIISAAHVLKSAIDKLHTDGTGKWIDSVLLVVRSIAGLLTFEDDTALQALHILRQLICDHMDAIILSSCKSQLVTSGVESSAITLICSVFEKLLVTCVAIPNKHILAVLSVLFLKLGNASCFHMRSIFLKLAELMNSTNAELSDTGDLQKCIGCAVVAMGPERILSIVPISFCEETLTCSNTWLFPILQKYIVGASLGYFMDHVVPTAEALQKCSRKGKKSVVGQDLLAHYHAFWSLLPAFCRYPVDITKKFVSLAKLLCAQIKKDGSKHKVIAIALQELVKLNKCATCNEGTGQLAKCFSDALEVPVLVMQNLPSYSKKQASKNIKILSFCSSDLLQALIDVFLASPPEKRIFLKDAIRCLASITDSSITRKLFISTFRKYGIVYNDGESEEFELADALANDTEKTITLTTDNSQWCLMLELASSLVEGAAEDLVGLIFKLTKKILQAEDGIGISEAYYTLSEIIEEHSWFCSSHFDELVDILRLKSPADAVSYLGRLRSLQTLLVFTLKSNSDADNSKAFQILNDIILALKESKEEARKMAYDVLLRIRSKLRDSSQDGSDEAFHRLINMMTGYLSGSSPHIISGAVSALSLLVYQEPDICSVVPDLVPSVLALLQGKAVEVVKATLGFVKVLASCQEAKELQNYVSCIVEAVLPWSSCSRHHFRSKVIVILEIMVRKCGSPPVELVTSEKYKSFLRKVLQNRHGKSMSKDANSVEEPSQLGDTSLNRRKPQKGDKKQTDSVQHERKKRKWADRTGTVKQTNSGKPLSENSFDASKTKRKVFDQSPRIHRKRKVAQAKVGRKANAAAYTNKGAQQKARKKFKRNSG